MHEMWIMASSLKLMMTDDCSVAKKSPFLVSRQNHIKIIVGWTKHTVSLQRAMLWNLNQTWSISISVCSCQYFVRPPFCCLRCERIVSVNTKAKLRMTISSSSSEYEFADMYQHTASSLCIETWQRGALQRRPRITSVIGIWNTNIL